jgi:hypothetical protein
VSLVDDYLRLRLGEARGPVTADAAHLPSLLDGLEAAEIAACARLGRLPPAQLAGRLAFARELDWSPVTRLLQGAPRIRLLASGPGLAIADIAALYLRGRRTDDPLAPVVAFLSGDSPVDELVALRARGVPVLAPWAELPACPPQDVASDLLPQLVSFCGAILVG